MQVNTNVISDPVPLSLQSEMASEIGQNYVIEQYILSFLFLMGDWSQRLSEYITMDSTDIPMNTDVMLRRQRLHY